MHAELRLITLAATLTILPAGGNSVCEAGNKVTLGQMVRRDQLVAMDQVDHGAWNTLLRQYVDERGNVAYAQWLKASGDVQALDGYLATLSMADPAVRAGRPAQLAFWINAYNAVTVRGILREYPTSSIRNHTAKLLGYNIWDDLLLTVG